MQQSCLPIYDAGRDLIMNFKEAIDGLDMGDQMFLIMTYVILPFFGCIWSLVCDSPTLPVFVIITGISLLILIISAVEDIISKREESLEVVKRNSDKMSESIKAHCKRSCTAENCNNCALRVYKEGSK